MKSFRSFFVRVSSFLETIFNYLNKITAEAEYRVNTEVGETELEAGHQTLLQVSLECYHLKI